MKTLLEMDPEAARRPLAERTPKWYVDLYLKHMTNLPAARSRRIVHDSDDSDNAPDVDIGIVGAHAIAPGQLKPGRSRALRRVRRAEIVSLIVLHKEWLIDDQSRTSKDTKLIDIKVWQRSADLEPAQGNMDVDSSEEEMPQVMINERRAAPVSKAAPVVGFSSRC